MIRELKNDVSYSFELLDKNRESQFYRRIALRNIFSFIEVTINVIKFELKRELRLGRIENKLTTKETEILYEEKISTKVGRNIKQIINIPLEKNLKGTFNIAKKMWCLRNYVLDVNSNEYSYFKKAKYSRNKLTHPKDYYDIQITVVDIKVAYLTYVWVKENFIKLFKEKINIGLEELPEDIKNRFWEEET